jgi:hypothetical protein
VQTGLQCAPASVGASAELPGSKPANPLPHTQAGMLEHQQIYLSELTPKDHAECVAIINQGRGCRRTWLSPYITHIVVDADCQEQEKRQIVRFLEESGSTCQVVSVSWLRACHEVRQAAQLAAQSGSATCCTVRQRKLLHSQAA